MTNTMSIDKKYPPFKEDSDGSVESSAEPEPGPGLSGTGSSTSAYNYGQGGQQRPQQQQQQKPPLQSPSQSPPPPQQHHQQQQQQQQKRKGGRKPIYATSEERKQRNRQAQAAFRERRTEYIKQLEQSLKVHDANLQKIQVAYRHASDEVLMLRYKNSLLERILVEKGIDVKAELMEKTGSSDLMPAHPTVPMVPPPPIQPRTMMNRHPARQFGPGIEPRLMPAGIGQTQAQAQAQAMMRAGVSTPSTTTGGGGPSHANSPPAAVAGPAFPVSPAPSELGFRGSIPAADGMLGDPRQQQQQQQQPMMAAALASGPGTGPDDVPFYFQDHMRQIDHEEYGQVDMMEEPEMESANPFPAASPFGQVPDAPPLGSEYESMQQPVDGSDVWDPFGLTASMQFPVQYPYNLEQF